MERRTKPGSRKAALICVIAGLLTLTLWICTGGMRAAATAAAGGECGDKGDNLTWTITEDGCLTVEGSGGMRDCSAFGSPWEEQKGKIRKIVLREGVTTVGDAAFSGCAGLTEVTLPGSVTKIEPSAFYGCVSLTEIAIPTSVTNIGWAAFDHCTGLEKITVPESVTSIGCPAFGGCTRLAEITVDPRNPAYRSAGNCLIERESGTLVQGCNASVLPADGSVKAIDSYAFSGCTGLRRAVLPEGVAAIGFFAFKDCTGLTEVTIPESVTSIEPSAFEGCTALRSVAIPKGVTTIASCAFDGCTGLTEVTISEGVTSIELCAFRGCAGLRSVVLPASVTKIEEGVFYDCTGLQSVALPASVAEIEGSIFYGCTRAGMEIFCESEKQPETWAENWLDGCGAVVHWGSPAPVPGGEDGDAPSGGDAPGTGDGTKDETDAPAEDPFFWSTVCLALLVIVLGAVLAVVLLRKKKSARGAAKS